VRLGVPEPTIGDGAIAATVLYTDRFGNAQLNVTQAQLDLAGITLGAPVDLELSVGRYPALVTRTFADTEPGGIIVYEDAYQNGSIAIRNGSAAETLALRAGQELRIHLRP
jgi:S-adenosyl-L-methionine hydrolase (adenosine-forming)